MTEETPTPCDEIVGLTKVLDTMEVVADSRGVLIRCPQHKDRLVEASRYIPAAQRKYVPEAEGWMFDVEMNLLYEVAFRVPQEMGIALEIGSWKGRSTSAFAMAGPVVCIDPFTGSAEHTKDGPVNTYDDFIKNLTDAGLLHSCIVLRSTSDVALAMLKGTPVRVALVDGSHETDQVAKDLANVWDMVVPGGVMFVDDIDWQSVHTAALEFAAERGIDWSLPIDGDGKLAVFAKKVP